MPAAPGASWSLYNLSVTGNHGEGKEHTSAVVGRTCSPVRHSSSAGFGSSFGASKVAQGDKGSKYTVRMPERLWEFTVAKQNKWLRLLRHKSDHSLLQSPSGLPFRNGVCGSHTSVWFIFVPFFLIRLRQIWLPSVARFHRGQWRNWKCQS